MNSNDQRNNKNNIFKLIIQIFLFFSIIKSSLTECPRDEPILKNGSCRLEYCSDYDFESKECIINNSIIKTQWINNIIIIGDLFYRYINLGSFSNGDMIVETNAYPANKRRMFYGLKQNGRPLFTMSGMELSYYLIDFSGENEGKFESEAAMITETTYGREFYFSVSNSDCNAEIIDYEKKNIYYKPSKDFASGHNIVSLRYNIFKDIYSYSNNYHYFCFIGEILDGENINNAIFLQRHIFSNFNSFNITNTKESEIIELNAYGYGISCFQSPKEFIYCLYLTKYDKIYFNLTKYEIDFTNKVSLDFESNVNDEYNFFKCIHFKDEIMVIVYYQYFENNLYPIILFKEFNVENQVFENYFSEGKYISGIILKRNFNNHLLLNDFIKLNNNKFVFSTTAEDKEKLYIIVINIFGNKKVKIRYYSINIYELYHFKIFYELRINNYKNFIAFASSFCQQKECSKDDDEHYSSLIIFSYPKNRDKVLNINEYIISNNITNFDDIEIDLDEDLKFESNIFGYVFSSKTIKDIVYAGHYKFFSSKNQTKEIEIGSVLDINEKLKLKYVGDSDNYETMEITISYYYNITEPELDIYNNYPEDIEGDDDELFEYTQYVGRSNNFLIFLGSTLTTNCENNECVICYKDTQNYCLSCKHDFLITFDFGFLFKKCIDSNDTDLIDEKNTDLLTETNTEKNMDEKTEEITQIITDNIF